MVDQQAQVVGWAWQVVMPVQPGWVLGEASHPTHQSRTWQVYGPLSQDKLPTTDSMNPPKGPAQAAVPWGVDPHIIPYLPGRDKLTIKALSLISMINYIWYDMIEREREGCQLSRKLLSNGPGRSCSFGGLTEACQQLQPSPGVSSTESPFSMQLVVIILAEHMRVFV